MHLTELSRFARMVAEARTKGLVLIEATYPNGGKRFRLTDSKGLVFEGSRLLDAEQSMATYEPHEDGKRVLHVYPSGGPHEDVLLVGNRAGLEALGEAIHRALDLDGSAMAQPMTGDGEGYRLFIVRQDACLETIPMPYTDEPFLDRRADAAEHLMEIWKHVYAAHVNNPGGQ